MPNLNIKQVLENSIYHLSTLSPFYANLLQQMTIKFHKGEVTASLGYSNKKNEFEISLSEEYFPALESKQRMAVLQHELMHLVHMHIDRAQDILGDLNRRNRNLSEETHKLLFNIAADLSINQYIENLPPGGVKTEQFKQKDGSKFPEFQSMEQYYNLLINEENYQQNKKLIDQIAKSMNHDSWEEGLTEEEKKAYYEALKNTVKRAIQKSSYSYSQLPSEIAELINLLEGKSLSYNYKQILLQAIKKTLYSNKRLNSWERKNKRYGFYAPGNKNAKTPKCYFFIDTSGSISVEELTIFKDAVAYFLKNTNSKCFIGFWSDKLYKVVPYTLGQDITKHVTEIGGTDISGVVDFINKNKPDLSLVITDGYYANASKIQSPTVFLLSKGGDENHPYKNHTSIMLEYLK